MSFYPTRYTKKSDGLNPDGTLPEPEPEEMSATDREKSGRAALKEYRANRESKNAFTQDSGYCG